jgi:hypothetical protein
VVVVPSQEIVRAVSKLVQWLPTCSCKQVLLQKDIIVGRKIGIKTIISEDTICRNPSLGLVTKARACKGASPEKSLGVASHVPGSVGECEGLNLHTPKGAPTLGVGVPADSQIFSDDCRGQNPLN